tara:strand:- start:1861 stop:2601 length:741 start_codon:yes stop_codon:yes gene_type:complete
MNDFTYNKLVYEQKELKPQLTNKPILYYSIKDKYKPIETLYIDITKNMNIYVLADKFNSITSDILAIYRTINIMMSHFDICPIEYVCFDSVKIILFMIHKFWVCNLSYIIEDRICLDEEFFLRGNVFAKKQIFHHQYDTDAILKKMKTEFTYENSIGYINNLKTKLDEFSDDLEDYVKDNRINTYLFKINEYINDYIKEYKFVYQTRAARVIQRAFRKYRYDPQYRFCERVQMNNMREIYNEFNSE